MCSTFRAKAADMSSFHWLKLSSGNPNIKSMLIFLMPASLSNFTACFTSSELWRLCRRRSLLSANVCAPMLTRFIDRRLSMFVNSGVMSSGLHSIVISAFLSTSYTLFIYRNSLVSSASSSNEGVPPPRYIVENGSRI